MSRTKFPYLTEVIRTAHVVELPRVDGQGTYRFRVYSFGERGSTITHQLIREITRGLAESAIKYFPNFDLVVGIGRGGGPWNAMLAYELEKPSTQFFCIEGYSSAFIRALSESKNYGFVKASSPYKAELLCYNRNAFKPNELVLVIDDVVSEGGTLDAVFNVLVNELYCEVAGAQVILAKSDSYKRIKDKWGVPIRFLKKIQKF